MQISMITSLDNEIENMKALMNVQISDTIHLLCKMAIYKDTQCHAAKAWWRKCEDMKSDIIFLMFTSLFIYKKSHDHMMLKSLSISVCKWSLQQYNQQLMVTCCNKQTNRTVRCLGCLTENMGKLLNVPKSVSKWNETLILHYNTILVIFWTAVPLQYWFNRNAVTTDEQNVTSS